MSSTRDDLKADPLTIALAAATQAGELLLEGLGRHHASSTKESSIDLVTEYDRRAEEVILRVLLQAFPGDEVLAEESGLVGAGGSSTASAAGPAEGAVRRRWIVDPLDGTTNFAHGLPFFAVSIACEEARGEARELLAGVVHAPALGLCFAARRGGGATCNGQPIHVSEEAELGRSLLATGFPYDRQTSLENNFDQFFAFQRRVQGVRRVGAAALDLALTARGAFDGYWEMKLKPWDLAAGALLVREAGGTVTGWQGEPLVIEKGAAVATNGRIHGAVLEVLGGLGIPRAAE
ncbi:MAG TPA: inositol monophosphatase family protein [Polyangia bacterium]|jgi:myo-inositol-1(or 4)-monophosphatase|nr:inositol monophosphatase family protein [Polyangia bacterium]